MSEANIDLPVFTALSTQAVPRRSWKKWDLGFSIFEDTGGKVSTHVTDHAGLLDTDRPPVINLAVHITELLDTAKDLEALWSHFSNKSTRPQHTASALAGVGRDLFDMLFPIDHTDSGAVSNLVSAAIRSAAAEWAHGWRKNPGKRRPPALSISFYSDRLHLPWNLLYPFEQFADYGVLGFLGIPFSIEEVSTFDSIANNSKKEWGSSRPVEVSLQLDLKLDKLVHDPVLDRLAVYPESELKAYERPNSESLSNALLHGKVSEELLYFCCHAHEAPPQIQLTDPEFISAVRIEKWVTAAKLSQWPIIFLNTCRGGLTHERYRTTFVSAFIRGGSVAVIGAEAEIDETYAAWFASEFIGALFEGNDARESLGEVANRVRQAGLTRPLGLSGLLYSVYSRVPVCFRGKLTSKKGSEAVDGTVQAKIDKTRGTDGH